MVTVVCKPSDKVYSLDQKKVLITGAAGGIGSELAKKLFFQQGASLLLVDKDREKLSRLREILLSERKKQQSEKKIQQTVETYSIDLSLSSSVEKLVAEIGNQSLDVLINNAGVVYWGSFQKMSLEDYQYIMEVNLHSHVKLTRLLLPKLVESRGQIAIVSSASGLISLSGMCAYSTSKFALVGFAEALRVELKGKVGVSVICPSYVSTDIGKNCLVEKGLSGEQKERRLSDLNFYVQKKGLDCDRVVKKIIRAIRKNQRLVVIGHDFRFLYFLKKWFPQFIEWWNRWRMRELLTDGG